MKRNQILSIFGIVIFFAVGFAYSQFRADSLNKQNQNSTPMPAASDGEYYVRIESINPEKQEAVFKHITFFTGTEAYDSAEHEVPCGKTDIVECVPSLKNGYYIRPSSPESGFALPTAGADIILANNKKVSVSANDLREEINLPGYEPAFKIQIKDNRVTAIEELTRYENSAWPGLPKGYVLDEYTVEKVLDAACEFDGDCKTPMEYALRSNCPYFSICEENKCAVICPGRK